jgi:hypothetical protein
LTWFEEGSVVRKALLAEAGDQVRRAGAAKSQEVMTQLKQLSQLRAEKAT